MTTPACTVLVYDAANQPKPKPTNQPTKTNNNTLGDRASHLPIPTPALAMAVYEPGPTRDGRVTLGMSWAEWLTKRSLETPTYMSL